MSIVNFPIVIDLSPFFHDHRRIARVCINKHIKTIGDLQDRITTIFSIQDFYLTTGNHFLPEVEEIGILNQNETVCAIPKNQNESKIVEVPLPDSPKIEKKAKKRRKRSLDDREECESISPKKKKSKSKSSENDELLLQNGNPNKIKRTHELETIEEESKKKRKDKKKQVNVEEEVCCIEGAQRVRDIKKKLKEKTEQHIKNYKGIESSNKIKQDIKDLLPRLQNHIKSYNDSGRSNIPDTVRLSRHLDTPIIPFKKYSAPAMITDQYLAKNKVNIVRIDVLKKEEDIKVSPSICNNSETVTPPKNSVQEIINTFEKTISPELNTSETETIKKCETSSIKLDQTKENLYENSIKIVENTNISVNKQVDKSLSSTPLKKDLVVVTKESDFASLSEPIIVTDISCDLSSIVQNTQSIDSLSFSINSINNSDKPADRKFTNSSKEFSGVGLLLESLRESDSVLSQESDTSNQYVTKRKRVRKHRKRNKGVPDKEYIDIKQNQVLCSKPVINTAARPSIHIKFEEENEDTIQEVKTVPERRESLKSSVIENIEISDENDEPVLENKNIFSEVYIKSSPSMKPNLQPKVGDVICFKILRMKEDYTPGFSNCIIGKVNTYDLDSQAIGFKILKGYEELIPPLGKLSITDVTEEEEEQQKYCKYKELLWSDLVEPKLLYP